MAATYKPGPMEADEMVAEVIREYCPELGQAGVRIGTVFAHAKRNKDGVITGPAMLKKGRRVLARIRRHTEEQRADGSPDATITYDGDEWLENDARPRGRARQKALTHHELCHLVVMRHPDSGRIERDSLDRPRLQMREHDWEITGFAEVARAHGADAYDVIEAREFKDRFGNLLFEFARPIEAPTLPGVEPSGRRSRARRTAAAATP